MDDSYIPTTTVDSNAPTYSDINYVDHNSIALHHHSAPQSEAFQNYQHQPMFNNYHDNQHQNQHHYHPHHHQNQSNEPSDNSTFPKELYYSDTQPIHEKYQPDVPQVQLAT
jgi:hypothetical protein